MTQGEIKNSTCFRENGFLSILTVFFTNFIVALSILVVFLQF